jgi:adenylate kinase
MSLNLFIVGPSGGGVTMQSKLIADKYRLANISMGQLLRDEIAKNSDLGERAKVFIDQGKWVPDEITFSVLKVALKKINHQNFILDGYPRAINQGPLLEQYLSDYSQNIDALIHLNIEFEEILNRRRQDQIKGIKFHEESRTDENPQSILQQHQSYQQTIGPILAYFSQTNRLFQVDANRSIELIFADICHFIDQITRPKTETTNPQLSVESLTKN